MLSSEVLTLESLHHPNILRLFEVIDMWNRVYLITEFIAGGELYNKISLDGPVREEQAIVLFRQLLDAVKYMHANSFVHRDIKAENVLLVSESQVKLADFGFSTKLKEPLEKLDTFCGSPPYAAPELFTEDHYIGQFVDIWALGVLLYFMVVGNMPFRAPTVPALRSAVLKGQYLLPNTLSEPCGRVIQRILVQTPLLRPTLDDLASSQWMVWGAEGRDMTRTTVGKRGKSEMTAKEKLSELWRRRRRQASSARSASHSRRGRGVEVVVPIACSTKRTDSVLDENYLFPIEVVAIEETNTNSNPSSHNKDNGGLLAGEQRPRRSMFSLGSLMKTKIGPMDLGVLSKGSKGQMSTSNNNNNNNNNSSIKNSTSSCVYSGDQNNSGKLLQDITVVDGLVVDRTKQQEKHSESAMIKGGELTSKDFEMVPTFAKTTNTFDEHLSSVKPSPVEVEALRLLNNWGISNAMLEQALGGGARNELMGIYRIVVHRLQMQEERQRNTKEDGESGEGKKVAKKKSIEASGCGGKCSGTSSNCVIL